MMYILYIFGSHRSTTRIIRFIGSNFILSGSAQVRRNAPFLVRWLRRKTRSNSWCCGNWFYKHRCIDMHGVCYSALWKPYNRTSFYHYPRIQSTPSKIGCYDNLFYTANLQIILWYLLALSAEAMKARHINCLVNYDILQPRLRTSDTYHHRIEL